MRGIEIHIEFPGAKTLSYWTTAKNSDSLDSYIQRLSTWPTRWDNRWWRADRGTFRVIPGTARFVFVISMKEEV